MKTAANDITFPTLHLNGSGFDNLFQANRAVVKALNAALEKLQQATPHGRDYYVQGNNAYVQARKEHELRIERLLSVKEEVTLILENLYEQNNT